MPRELKGAASSSHRFKAIDWLRGLSVLFMIECHCLYFLSPTLEKSQDWYQLQAINGLVSVAFLFAAGFSSGLVISRAAGDASTRARRSRRTLLRTGEVVLLALYFSQASYDVISHPIWLLRPDILWCIVAGLVGVWTLVTACRGRHGVSLTLLSVLWLGVMVGTLWASGYRSSSVFVGLFNNSTGAMFPLLPWTGYLLLGAIMGVLAAHPTAGQKRLVLGLMVMTAVGLLLAETAVGERIWRALSARKLDAYIVSNGFERIWKLGAICLALWVVEWAASKAAAIAWSFQLFSMVLNYFSSYALSAYFVHRTLLYGFLGIQITQVWHRKSSWMEYWWRLGVMLCLTAMICYALHRARRAIEGMIRKARGTPVGVAARVG